MVLKKDQEWGNVLPKPTGRERTFERPIARNSGADAEVGHPSVAVLNTFFRVII